MIKVYIEIEAGSFSFSEKSSHLSNLWYVCVTC